jgi:vancomycin resistance protein VanJ
MITWRTGIDLTAGAALGVSVLILATDWAYLDALRQIAPHLAAAALVIAAVALVRNAPRAACLLGLCAAALAWTASPHALAPQPTAASARFTLFFHNAHSGKSDPQAILDLIAAEDPDVAALVEIYPHERRRIDALRARYPHMVQLDDHRPIAIFSKRPMTLLRPPNPDWPTATYVSLASEIGPIALGVVHLSRPWPFSAARFQNAETARLLETARALQQTAPAILVGDFNATPWGRVARRLGRAGLSPVGGLEGTWPTIFPALIRTPIDNAFVSAGLRPARKRVLASTGSDHLPVLFVFEAADQHAK